MDSRKVRLILNLFGFMTQTTMKLQKRFYQGVPHPYKIFEETIDHYVGSESTVLDIGCGRDAPILRKYQGKARFLFGLDPEIPNTRKEGNLELFNGSIYASGLTTESIDVAFSRSVMEHLDTPDLAFKEVFRLIKPGGHFIFLTPNFYDYGSILSWIIPNQLHPYIVSRVEGRMEADVFPVYYRANTFTAISRLTTEAGFQLKSFKYLGQYPNYLMFNSVLFLLGTAFEKVTSKFEVFKCLRGWLLVCIYKPKV